MTNDRANNWISSVVFYFYDFKIRKRARNVKCAVCKPSGRGDLRKVNIVPHCH